MSFVYNNVFKNIVESIHSFIYQVESLEVVQNAHTTISELFQKGITTVSCLLSDQRATLLHTPKLTLPPISDTSQATTSKTNHVADDALTGKTSQNKLVAIVNNRVVSDCTEPSSKGFQNYLKGISDFSFEILQKKINDSSISTSNYLISPLSISMLMAMDMHGVDVDTKKELSEYIHLPDNELELQACVMKMMEALSKAGVKIANLLYLNPQYRLDTDFKQIISQNYKGKALEGNNADDINAWVQEMSNGLIKDIVSQRDLQDFFLAMANAIYFKGAWISKFDADDTLDAAFKCPGPSGEIEREVKMMTQTGSFRYYEDDLCQAVEMPYTDAQGMAMTLILPRNYNEFSFVDAKFFEKVKEEMYQQEDLKINLPKFKIEGEVDVKEALQGMGMHQLFEKPDFSNMVDLSHQPTAAILPELIINKIIQKSVLAVNEEGTEAATVTVQIILAESCICLPPAQKLIDFDKPFLTALTYQGVPILFGSVRAPDTIS